MTAPADLMADALNVTNDMGKLQYHKMKAAQFRDQHGRIWSTQIDTTTLHPCTPLTPANWSAPHPWLVPPAKYLDMGATFGTIEIAYDRWLVDVSEARRDYEAWVLECARKLFGGAALAMIQQGDPQLRAFAGPGPMSPEFIRAMKSGVSKWVLGLKRPDGTRYPMPGWAVTEMASLQVRETWDGSDVELTVDASKYADVEDEAHEDALARAARIEAQLRYGDEEDAADPDGAADFEPIKRRRGRPPKVREG